MIMRFFDFEVFPNWWCCTFGDLLNEDSIDESIKKDFVVVTSDDTNARDKLINLMREPNHCVVGYNIKYYDLIIATYN